LTFVSKDRSGIVALVAKVLYEKGFNIKDSSSTRLSDVFSMILMVEHDELFDDADVKSWFGDLSPSVHRADSAGADDDGGEHYLISVYGADKPGIVFTIADTLAKEGINITDLQTRISGVYVMVLEITIPAGYPDGWLHKIKAAAESIKTDITVRKIETYEL
jgi:glycine cleavage system transcriptional repressor